MAVATVWFLVNTSENRAPGAAAGGHGGTVAVCRVAAHQDLSGDPGGAGGGHGLGDHAGCAFPGVGLAGHAPNGCGFWMPIFQPRSTGSTMLGCSMRSTVFRTGDD
jgi:hypothetical protein